MCANQLAAIALVDAVGGGYYDGKHGDGPGYYYHYHTYYPHVHIWFLW